MKSKNTSNVSPQKPVGGNEKKRKTAVLQSDVPRHTLTEALRVPRAICDNYAKNPTKPLRVAEALDLSLASSNFRTIIGASSAYELTSGSYNSDTISITDIGRRILAPTEEGMSQIAMKEAFLCPLKSWMI